MAISGVRRFRFFLNARWSQFVLGLCIGMAAYTAVAWGSTLLPVHMSGKIVTPSSSVGFALTEPAVSVAPIQTQIYSLQGRRIAQLRPEAPGHYQWDGRDELGRAVESGPYLVQIQQDDARWNGVVLVIR